MSTSTNPELLSGMSVESRLLKLIQTNDEENLRAQLDKPEALYFRTSKGNSLLHLSATNNRPSLCRLLIEHDFNPNRINRKGLTPLHIAVEKGFLEVIHALTGANVNARTADGKTALHYLAANAPATTRNEIFEFLIQRGADLNALNSEWHTPLHTAIFTRNTSIAKLLIEHGADISITTPGGKTPKGLAQSLNLQAVVRAFPIDAPAPEPKPSPTSVRAPTFYQPNNHSRSFGRFQVAGKPLSQRCGKIPYASKHLAYLAMGQLNNRGGDKRNKRLTYAYKCTNCGAFHLTSERQKDRWR